MDVEQPFVYDLLSELRKNPTRRREVEAASRHVDNVTQGVLEGKFSRSEITKAEAALVPLCGFNFGLLIPRVFVRYPRDQPLDFAARPFMYTMTTQAPGSVVTLKAGRQVGKCADGDTEVITPDGGSTLRELFRAGLPV